MTKHSNEIRVRHSDGMYGVLFLEQGVVIWADGHGDKFDLSDPFDFKLLCQMVVAGGDQ